MQTPARIGQYEIQRHLATGGMAETFLALRHGPEQTVERVCFKRIRADKVGRKEFVDQFEREARIAASLQHSHIVRTVDFGLLEGEPYLAQEFIDGADLGRLIREPVTRGAVDAALVTHVAVEVATALEFAHRAGVLHRDVSPCNILVSADGDLKLADFGIAKVLGRTDPDTLQGRFKGKVAYVAPEYVRTSRVGPRGDLYSLGITLYEALCGQRPYDDLSALATFERAARGEHVRLLDRNPALPLRLCALVEALIHPDPASRPESATALLGQLRALPRKGRDDLAELVQRLQRYTADTAHDAPTVALAVSSPPAPATRSTVAQFSRQRLPWIAAAVLAVTVTLVIALCATLKGPTAPSTAAPRSTVTAHAPSPPLTVPEPVPEPVPALPLSAWTTPQPDQPRATLHVIVVPFGQVWVDQRYAGRSPLSVEVAPGEHVVRVVSPRGRFTRTFRAEPGARERVLFR